MNSFETALRNKGLMNLHFCLQLRRFHAIVLIMEIRNLPIGIHDFKYMRENGCVYVDKTAYVYRMAKQGKPYFLSRPRRFGKSLMVSTLKAYFEGKKELFQGLEIAELEKEWTQYPVFLIDLNVGEYGSVAELKASLASRVRVLEDEWGAGASGEPLASRFESLIHRAAVKTGKNVVVLIDEYAPPWLSILRMKRFRRNSALYSKAFTVFLNRPIPDSDLFSSPACPSFRM